MYKTLSVGEVLWDIFPDYKKPGGSPANVAYHLHGLGTESLLLSRIGLDENGKELLNFLETRGINTKYIQKDPNHPTGIVNVVFDKGEPSYTIQKPSSWDFIELTNSLEEEFNSLDAICFASLSQRNNTTKKTVQKILSSVDNNCLKVFDLNLRPPFIDEELILDSIHKADVIKINEYEYKTLSDWYGDSDFAEKLVKKNPSKTFLLTEGEKGSAMYTSEGFFHENAHPISGDGDFVGVGDAFLACFTFLKIRGTGNDQILSLANHYAAFVASQKGGMPDIPQSIIEQIN